MEELLLVGLWHELLVKALLLVGLRWGGRLRLRLLLCRGQGRLCLLLLLLLLLLLAEEMGKPLLETLFNTPLLLS